MQLAFWFLENPSKKFCKLLRASTQRVSVTFRKKLFIGSVLWSVLSVCHGDDSGTFNPIWVKFGKLVGLGLWSGPAPFLFFFKNPSKGQGHSRGSKFHPNANNAWEIHWKHRHIYTYNIEMVFFIQLQKVLIHIYSCSSVIISNESFWKLWEKNTAPT